MKLAKLVKSSNLVRVKRLKRKLSLGELAEASGVKPTKLKAIEANKAKPLLEEATRLSRVLGVKVGLLFSLEFEKKKKEKKPARIKAKKKMKRASGGQPSKRVLPLLTLMAGKREPSIQKKVVRLVGGVGARHLGETLATVRKWKRKNPALVKKCAGELRRRHKGDRKAYKLIREALA